MQYKITLLKHIITAGVVQTNTVLLCLFLYYYADADIQHNTR